MGMAFVDTLLTETDATVVLIDENHQPGGHWNSVYPLCGCTSRRRTTA